MTHRLTRRDLRHDTFLESVTRAQAWVQDHAYLVAGAAVVAVVLVFVAIGITRHSISHRKEMEETFARCALDFDRGNFPTAAVAFENYIARYPGSSWAREAAIRAAASYLFVGNLSSAQDLYERYLAKYQGDPILDRAAKAGLAACYEGAGRLPDAARLYRELAEAAGNPEDRATSLLAAARCEEQQGNLTQAYELQKTAWQTAGPQLRDPALRARLTELDARQHIATRRSDPFTPTPLPTPAAAPGA